jgi:glycosyltransferase involved in cell wall biosynthesis
MPAARSRVTIVTPSYNQRSYLAETIASVLSQEGEFELEYFVMDGGSNDGSVDVIAEYAERVTSGEWPVRCAGITFEWVTGKDRGQTDAINQGFRRGTGDIVAWINSDDTYAPGALARVVRAFDNSPDADFIYGDGEVIDEQSRVQWPWLSRPYDLRVLTSYHFLWNDFTNYVMQQSTFWRRSVMEKIGYLDESFHYGMDIEYWIRAGNRGLMLRHVPEILGRFRLIEGTKSLSSVTAFWPDYLEIFRRYRGVTRLAPFFAFYYYNLARQHEFDPETTSAAGDAILARWSGQLPVGEFAEMTCQAQRGAKLGALLTARDLLAAGQLERAKAFVRASRPLPLRDAFHPFTWPYWLRRLAPAPATARVESGVRAAIRVFRRYRYDYRYQRLATR